MNPLRVLGYLLLVGQLGLFGQLVYQKLTGIGLAKAWSWWGVCAPLYVPLCLSLAGLVLTWLYNRAYQTLFPQ